jgi:hypothetical protein
MHVLENSSNSKVHLAGLSVLRHFCIAKETKAYLGQVSVLETALPFLTSSLPDIALTAVVILRHLCSEGTIQFALLHLNFICEIRFLIFLLESSAPIATKQRLNLTTF